MSLTNWQLRRTEEVQTIAAQQKTLSGKSAGLVAAKELQGVYTEQSSEANLTCNLSTKFNFLVVQSNSCESDRAKTATEM